MIATLHSASVAIFAQSLLRPFFAAVRYLEQPTSRDIQAYPQNWREVTQLKPLLLDEGLTSLPLPEEAQRQHWSGLALKTCKGYSFSLVCAAWAHRHGMLLSLQDLTNSEFSATHSYLLGAHLSTLNGEELNSPQYTPAADQPWLSKLAPLFEVHQGVHTLREVNTLGLGSSLVNFS